MQFGFTADHSYRGDIKVTVTSPSSTTAVVIDENSIDFNDNYDVLLGDSYNMLLDNDVDDNTAAPYYDRAAKPSNVLSIFNLENAKGDWLISLCDNYSGDNGFYYRSALKFFVSDFDDDGVPDAREQHYGLNPFLASDAVLDNDGDGRPNLDEYTQGTNPLVADTKLLNFLPVILQYLLKD